jgi:hypothetical protein
LVNFQPRVHPPGFDVGQQRTKGRPRIEAGPSSSIHRKSAQPTSSVPLKKKAISRSAFSSLSLPWTALRPLFSA